MNFKVKCVGYVEPVTERGFTIGKVYDVVNGVITRDDGFKYDAWSDPKCGSDRINTFGSLCKWFKTWYKFELVTEPNGVKFDEDAPNAPRFWSKIHSLAPSNDKIVITHDGKTTTATLYRENGSKEVATAKCSPEDTFDFNFGAKLAMERLMKKVEPVPVKKEKYTVGDRIFAEDNINRHPGGAWGTVEEVLNKRIHAEDYFVTFDDGSCLCSHVVPVPTTPEPPKYFTGKVICIDSGNVPKQLTVGKIYKFLEGRAVGDHGNQITSRPITDCEHLNSMFDRTGVKFIPIVE